MSEIIKKKANIFPFDVDIDSVLGAQKGKIHKINLTGAIIEVFHSGFVAQKPIKMKFTLPIDNEFVEIEGKIMKTYNKHKGEKIEYLIEVHFKGIKIGQQDAIDVFIRKNNALTKRATDKKEKVKKEL